MTEPSRHEIWKMFDHISRTYDRANRLMTLGLDLYWRKKVASLIPLHRPIDLLDLATGTADQIVSAMEARAQILKAVGIDLAEEMLRIGQKKIAQKPYRDRVLLQKASALEIPYHDHSFDCVTISFGIRNVVDVCKALSEMHRVLKPQGKVLILEGSLSSIPFLRECHLFYLRNILPRIGGFISKHRDAYLYLNRTIETFPSGAVFCQLMTDAGFSQAKAIPLTGGVVSIYSGEK